MFSSAEPLVTDWLMVAITFLGVISTLIIGLFTFIANRNAGRASEQAAAATEAATEANARAQDAQLRLMSEALARNASAVPKPGVKWRITKDGRKYELTNVGDIVARAVSIEEISDASGIPQDLYAFNENPVDLAPGASLPFSIDRSIASPAVTPARISWTDDDENPSYEDRLLR